MERTTKVLGGLGASLAIVVAGASGISWLTRDRAEIADAEVVEIGGSSYAESPELSSDSPTEQRAVGDLSVEGKPTSSLIYSEHWIVSPGAVVEEFPVENTPVPALSCLQKDFLSPQGMLECVHTTPGCTEDQENWLSQNAVLASPGLFASEARMGLGSITLKNTGKSGQSISFKDIRLEAEFSAVPDAGFSIICSNYNDFQGGAATGYSSTRGVILSANSGSAVFGEPSSSGEDLTRHIPAGMPAVFNLAAGETANAYLSVIVPGPVGTVSGRVLATVSAADGEQQIKLPLDSLNAEDAVYTSMPRPTVFVDGGAICPADTTLTGKYTQEKICSFSQLELENQLG